MATTNQSFLQRILSTEPLAVRTLIVAVFGVVAMLLNHTFADGTVQSTVDFIVSAIGLVNIVLVRGSVTPNSKVVSYKPDPKLPEVVTKDPNGYYTITTTGTDQA